MACILYRKGKGTQEFGIECESTTCEVEYLDSLLADGWSVNPPGYVPPATVVEDATDDETDDTPLNPVREAAKAAGIEGWDTKRIGTLQKALEA